MGTNYYWYESDTCPHCGRDCEPLHIGKSSGGWCFGLHVYPDDEIESLNDWRDRWNRPGSVIRDEYGKQISPEEMLSVVTQRAWPRNNNNPSEWYRANYAQPGPNGLTRSTVDGQHCIGHGEGTWDYCVGEFS